AGARSEVSPGRRLDVPGARRGPTRATHVALDALDRGVRPEAAREDHAGAPGRGAARRGQQPGGVREEARGHPPDGGGQQGLRSLPLVRTISGGRRNTPRCPPSDAAAKPPFGALRNGRVVESRVGVLITRGVREVDRSEGRNGRRRWNGSTRRTGRAT